MAGIPSKFGSWLSGAVNTAGNYISKFKQDTRASQQKVSDVVAGRQAASVQPSYSSLTSTQSTQKPSTGIPYSNVAKTQAMPTYGKQPTQTVKRPIQYSEIASSPGTARVDATKTGGVPYASLINDPSGMTAKKIGQTTPSQSGNGIPMQATGSSTAPVFGQVGDGFTSGMDMNAWVADQYAKLNEKNAGASSASGNESNGNMTMQSTQGYQPSALDQQIAALQKQLAGTYSMGSDESALQSQLTDLQGNTALGVSGLEGQGRGIPLGLVRGQQEKLQTQGNLKAQTLEQQLANLMSQRQMKQQGLQTQLGFAQKQYDTEQAKLNPMQVGNSIIQYDPATGQYVTKYSAPQQAAEQPSIVQEFEYAKNNGYSGSFLDYQNAKGQGSGGGGGFTLGNTRYDANGNVVASAPETAKPLSAESQKLQANVNAASRSLDDMRSILVSPTGNNGVFGRPLIASGTYKAAEANLVDVIGRLRSGGAISVDEEKQFRKLLPGRLDSQATVEYKLNRIQQFLQDAMGSVDQGGGQSGQDDPLGLGFSNAPSTAVNGSLVLGSNLARANNNPGNLRYVGQSGATQGQGGFAKFSSPQAGFNALVNQIGLDASRGATLTSFIGKYAPSSENNTAQYIQQVSSWLGIDPNTPLSRIDRNTLAQAMARKESSSYFA